MAASRPLLLAVFCGLALGTTGTLEYRAGAAPEAPLPYDELHNFVEVLSAVQNNFVDPVDQKRLFQGAMRGMLSGLEPHSRYLDADELSEMNVETTGKYGGIGVDVQLQDNVLKVVAPIDGGPAAAAGIKTGDVIVAVDGAPVAELKFGEAVKRMRGDVGTKVTLKVQRGAAPPFDVALKRDIIKVANVRSRMVAPGVGYLRIARFTTETGREVADEFAKLDKKTPLSGLVLDLRNNPGGVLDAAVAVADEFLDDGVIVTQRGRIPSANHTYKATPGDLLKGKPLVVMVNGGSASASEVLAGALHDRKRALLVGTRTFGKGLVQNLMPMQGGDAIVLTIARYYTPNGTSIQAEGIAPDIDVGGIRTAKADTTADDAIREADLAGSLANEKKPVAAKVAEDEKAVAQLAETDFALYESVEAIRGLIAYHPVG